MALRGSAFHCSVTATTNTITHGLSIQLNDIIILSALWGAASATFTLPSGFATIPGLANQNCTASETMMALAYKVATGSEPASYTLTGPNAFSTVVVRVYSGRNTVSPFTAVAATAPATADAPITYALTGLTPAASDDVVEFVGNTAYQGSAPGFTVPPAYGSALVAFATTVSVPILISCDYQGSPASATGTNGGKLNEGTLTGLGYCAQQISLAALNPDTLTASPIAFSLTLAPAAVSTGIGANAFSFALGLQPALLFVGAAGYELLAAPLSFSFQIAAAAEGIELDADPIPFAFALAQDIGLFGSLFITAAPLSFSLNSSFASFAISNSSALLPTIGTRLEVYDNLNGSMVLLWGEMLNPPADGFNIYVNDVLWSQVVFEPFGAFAFGVGAFGVNSFGSALNAGHVATVSGLRQASYSASTVAVVSGNSLRPQNMPPAGLETPSGTYEFKVVAVKGGIEVAAVRARATASPSSVMLVTPMKRIFPFPNTDT